MKDSNALKLNEITFDMLTADTVSEFLDSLETQRGCSISTRNNRLAAIKAFIAYAAAMDIMIAAVQIELDKVPKKKTEEISAVRYMTEAAVSAILAVPDASKEKGLRDRCLMILMYDTGARVQEVIDIKLRDFRFGKTPTATLLGKGGKVRTVPLMEKTVAHLKEYISSFHSEPMQNSDEHLFYSVIHGRRNPLSNDCIGKFIKRYGAAAKENCAEVPDNVHPHLFRHSRAMHLYQHGMDLTLVSQWLGHANLETTLVYAHADTEHKRKAIANATAKNDPLFGKLNPARFTIDDEESLKRLYGLK